MRSAVLRRTLWHSLSTIRLYSAIMSICTGCVALKYHGVEVAQCVSGMKTCRICKLSKELSEFHLNVSSRVINGRAYSPRYRSECKVCRSSSGKAHSSAGRVLMQRYNMVRPPLGTPCFNCGKRSDKLVFDHDHNTNAFRGWLCTPCNTAIGNLGDNAKGLRRALRYIEKSKHVQKNTLLNYFSFI
jgi:hypothetical protein